MVPIENDITSVECGYDRKRFDSLIHNISHYGRLHGIMLLKYLFSALFCLLADIGILKEQMSA